MPMDRDKRFSDLNGSHDYSNGKIRDDNGYGIVDLSEGYRDRSPSRSSASKILRIPSPSPSSSPPPSTSSPPLPFSSSPGAGLIEHRITKFDTLAGIAIKYGVEVADIKKMNGLVTDLQMFALTTLMIPSPGRHPPSPCLSSNLGESSSEQASPYQLQTPLRYDNQNMFDSFQSLRLKSSERRVSSAMSSLQGYYGLKQTSRAVSEGFEMANYKKGACHRLEDDHNLRSSQTIDPPLNRHRKSRSLVNAILAEVGELDAGEVDSDQWNDKLMRRRQKSEADFTSRTPEMLLKEDNNTSNGGFSGITGKGLALRSKAASRTNLAIDNEAGSCSPFPSGAGLMDDSAADSIFSVRKSSSASSLQERDGNSNGPSSSSLWLTSKWGLKPEMLTTAAITSSIFDGLPKPLTGRRNKTALD